jgi:hypothetical protein
VKGRDISRAKLLSHHVIGKLDGSAPCFVIFFPIRSPNLVHWEYGDPGRSTALPFTIHSMDAMP